MSPPVDTPLPPAPPVRAVARRPAPGGEAAPPRAISAATRLATWLGGAGVVLVFLSFLTNADLDMFHEMALAREIVAGGAVPQHDRFAFTPTVPRVVHHEWGTGMVLYLAVVATGAGATGLMLLKTFLVAGLLAAAYRCARRRGASAMTVVWMGWVAVPMLSIGLATVRAQLFTLLLLAVLLLLLERDRRGERWWIATWLPLFAVWVNLHAGFVVGLGLFGLYAAERFARVALRAGPRAAARGTWHLAAGGVAMLLLVGANPYGWAYVPYLWEAIRLERPLIQEWQPIWVNAGPLLGAYLLSLLPLGLAVVRRGWRLVGLPMVLAAAFLAMEHTRHLSIYAVLWICYVPGWLRATGVVPAFHRWSRRFAAVPTGAGLAAGIVGTTFALSMQVWQLRVPTTASTFPVTYPAGAVEYLGTERFAGDLMTPFAVGAYVSWTLYPQVRVGMDSRYEVAYPPAAIEENFRLYQRAGGAAALLDRLGADAVLVPRSSPLDTLLAPPAVGAERRGWRRVYRDDEYSVVVRSARAAGMRPVDRRGERIVARFP